MRIMRKGSPGLSFLIIMAGLWVATSRAGAAPAEPLDVYTVNYPLQYFAERIGGQHVKVTFPAPADVDPAYWIPDIETITAYQQADLILLNGAGYARWVKKVSLPRSKMVDTARRFSEQFITSADAVTHSHGPKGKHAHESLAFTTWLDFALAARQAEEIAAAFIRKLPARRDAFMQNLAALTGDLKALDAQMRKTVGREPDRPLVASHPVYDYLARAYGMKLRSVHWEPDETPGDGQWSDLQAVLKTHPARWMIWEATPMPASVQRLESIPMGSLVFDPCGNRPERGDFMRVMRDNIDALKNAYE